MREGQTLFQRTGGSHAAVLFEGSGVWRGLAEDIGRHNALDKVLGLLLLEGRSPRGLGAVLSGRVSGEMVAKAVQAGLEILAAVSAPSAMAVEVAAASGLTLCAFVRENRMTVFTHPYRIRDLR
jgi:FdhD protein